MFNMINGANNLESIDSKVNELYDQVSVAKMHYRTPENAQFIADMERDIDVLIEKKMKLSMRAIPTISR